MKHQPELSESPINHVAIRSISSSLFRRILSAGFFVALAMLVFKFLGLIQARLIGGYCDHITRDLFSFSYDTVFMGIFLIGEEAFTPVFLPLFMTLLSKDEKQAWEFAGAALTFQFLLTIILAGICGLFPEQIVSLLTAWDVEGANPLYSILAPKYIRYMSLGLFGMCLSSLTYMILNGYKRFFRAALGDAFLKAGIISGLVIGVSIKGDLSAQTSVIALSSGVITGSLFKLLIHLTGLRKELPALKLNIRFSSPIFLQYLWLVLPLLGGVFFARFRDTFNQAYILSNIHEEGLLAANVWGRKIYQAVSAILPYALSIAVFPFLCELQQKQDKEKQGELLTQSCTLLLLLCMPLSAMLCGVVSPLTRMIYETGRFGANDSILVATSTFCYTVVLPAYALEMVLMQAYFAEKKTPTVTLIGIVFSVLSIGISAIGILHFHWHGTMALIAVAGGYTFSRMLKTLVLMAYARTFIPIFGSGRSRRIAALTVLISILVGITAYLTANSVASYESPIVQTMSGMGGGGIAFILLMAVCCNKECTEILRLIRAYLRKPKGV